MVFKFCMGNLRTRLRLKWATGLQCRYLYGTVGRGKSMLMDELVAQASSRDVQVRRVHAYDRPAQPTSCDNVT